MVELASRTSRRWPGVAPFWAAFGRFLRHGCSNHCAAISYYALLSFVPFVSLLAAILGYVLGSHDDGVHAVVERLEPVLPDALPQLERRATLLVENRQTLGILATLAGLWSASLVFASVQRAINQIYELAPPPDAPLLTRIARGLRPFLLFLTAVAALLGAFLLQNLLAVMRSLAPEHPTGVTELLEHLPGLSLLATSIVAALAFAIVLRTSAPRRPSWRALAVASIVGAIGWEVAEQLFAVYIGSVTSRLSVTGSAGALIMFLLWIYYVAAVLLYCLELLDELDSARERGQPSA